MSTKITDRTTEAVVASVADMEPGTMKMSKVGEHRVVVIRTESGFHALDNACPHQGYGLATGALDGDLVTCQWHNWKYRVTDGKCVIGEEDVPCHAVRLDGDDVVVSVTEPTNEERLAKLWPSLRFGIERFYRGQIARDTARLLEAGASPDEIIADALRRGVVRTEWGMGHEMAVSADLLALSDSYDGIDRALPVVQALTAISEETRDRPAHGDPEPVTANPDKATFIAAIEAEDWATAVAALNALGVDQIETARDWFIGAVSQHHYNYGHGLIYTQKTFELIERLPDLADVLLPELALVLTYGTREDTLPYMRKAIRAIDALDTVALATAPASSPTAAQGLVDLLLDADQAPIEELSAAVMNGLGIEGLLNVVSLAAAHRMLRHDLTLEVNTHDEFGWLDITHVMTYVNAARWAWAENPGPEVARLVFMTAWLAHDSGRGERRNDVTPAPLPEPAAGDLGTLVRLKDHVGAVAAALAGEPSAVADELERMSMEDTAGSFIVMAHLVKNSVAARAEAAATGSPLPLAATARFLASPRMERFVTRAVVESMEFIQTGRPPAR